VSSLATSIAYVFHRWRCPYVLVQNVHLRELPFGVLALLLELEVVGMGHSLDVERGPNSWDRVVIQWCIASVVIRGKELQDRLTGVESTSHIDALLDLKNVGRKCVRECVRFALAMAKLEPIIILTCS
jgi:hypothetical protein